MSAKPDTNSSESSKKTDVGKDVASEKKDSQFIKVKIYSPFKTYFDDMAISISAENDTGPFDILPKHHNFMTLLNAGVLTVRKTDGEQKYRIARGVMHVRSNKVIVFLDV